MRVLPILFLLLSACWAQSDEAKVADVLKKLERAEQTGDFNAWAGLWSREKLGELESIRPYARPRPERQYRASKIFVRGDNAAVLAEAVPGSFVTMTLHREGGEWRIRDQAGRNTAADPNCVYALVPPDPGAFASAGSPWDQIAPGMEASQAAGLGWQMKAVFDESYLYVQIESSAELPAPGSTIQKPPGGWPVLKIGASGAGEFVLFDAVNVGDQATFDQHGKANSHRAYAAYMMRLERKGQEVFSAAADLQASPLVTVAGRYYEMRIPLGTMGIVDSRSTRITIGDAQWPKSALVSIAVRRYPPP